MMGRNPWTLLTALVLVPALAWTVSSGQERPVSTELPQPATTKAATLDLEQKDAMAEILRIRRRHGDLLAGSIFAELTEETDAPTHASTDRAEDSDRFAQALKRVMQRPADASDQPDSGEQPVNAALTQRCEAAYARATDSTSEPMEDTPFCRSLRRSARLLDRRANDLEDTLQFVEADRLRELASQLRIEARDLPTLRTARSK